MGRWINKRLIYIFVIFFIVLFISGCEGIKGSRIDRDLDDNINYMENVQRELIGEKEYFIDNNLILREAQENIEFVQTPLESELEQEQPKYHGYIIEFENEPVIERKIELENAQAELRRDDIEQINILNIQLDDYYDELVNQHNEIKSAFSNRINDFDNKLKGEYYKTFNGIALDINKEELSEIRNLDNVKNVYPNYEVKIMLEEEPVEARPIEVEPVNWDWYLDITNVQDAWDLGYTGEGVTIAIIDTGIDYTHPDLMGKVIEEHCYVGCPNGENEQHGEGAGMDDHGHGTHVAGIAAGNLFGVAPNADLISIKVINSEGWGYTSDVIRGIETAVDPDGDNDFEDHYDIISMSLGGEGDPNNPDVISVDNAVNAGVVTVVAAGNSGPYYESIGCPGCARKAITIGASDYEDNIAWFSSKGPTSIGTIKPDVVAPGVDICSAQWDNAWEDRGCYDDEHVSLSGTSMSTPLVSGAVALIKQAHPDWSPVEIKMALRNTGVDLNEDVFTQGYGRVDVLEAVSLEHAPPVAELFTSGEVNRSINITGTVEINRPGVYTLSYGRGRNPSEWTRIFTSPPRPINLNNVIVYYNFDTSYIDDEEYTLKLIARYMDDGEISEDKTLININNIEITNPLDYDILRAGDIIEIEGSILNNGFQNYEIEWGVGENPQEWFDTRIQLVNNGRNREGVLARFDTSSIDEADFYSIRLTINTDRNILYEYSVVYLDPTIKEGWPVTIEGSTWIDEDGIEYHLWIGMLSPVIEDLENDGDKELIFLTQEEPPHLYVLGQNGEILSDTSLNCYIDPRYFPSITNLYGNRNKEIVILCDDGNNPKMLVFDNNGNLIQETLLQYRLNGPLYDAAVLGDINRDGLIEIIYGGWMAGRDNPGSYLVVLNHEGEILDGFPVRLENVQSSTPNTPTIGNLDNDRDLEIVIISHRNNDEELSNIRVYNSNGSLLWSQEIESIVDNDPVIGDVNNDGYNEIIFASSIGIHILNRFGDYILNLELGDYPSATSQVALADLDNNNDLELIFGYGYNIYAMHHNGDEIFSYETDGFTHHPPVIGDINGDNSLDIIFNSDNDIYALNSQGELLNNFPIKIKPIAYSSPSIDDIDGDGNVELITSSNWLHGDNGESHIERGIIYIWDLEERYNPSKMPWPMYQHDPQHTGLYKYLFSCSEEYFRNWYDEEGNRIRQDEYDILEDQCGGFRCLSNNNEISVDCYNEQECREVCTGSNLCLDVDEWQEICEEQEPYCGNGIKEGREQCDGDDWENVIDCRDLGYDGGRLRCVEIDEIRQRGLIPCRFDTSQCYYEEDREEFIRESEIPEIQPIVENINLKHTIINNQIILEWDNIIGESSQITAKSIITITGNAIRNFKDIINAVKSLFKPKVRGIKLEDNLYRIYKSTDVNNPKQRLIIEGSKEDFNCNIKCKFNYVEDKEGIYYYSVEINGKIFSVGPVEIKKKEIIPEETIKLPEYTKDISTEKPISTKDY